MAFTVANTKHTHKANPVTLSVLISLTAASAKHAHSAQVEALTATALLAVSGGVSGHAATQTTLVNNAALAVNGDQHTHNVSAPQLNQNWLLNPSATVHSQTAMPIPLMYTAAFPVNLVLGPGKLAHSASTATLLTALVGKLRLQKTSSDARLQSAQKQSKTSFIPFS